MKRITMISFFGCLASIAIGFSAPSALAGNKVLSLDGDGDYVEVFDNDSLDLTNTLTLEAWVLPYREFAAIIAKGDTIESYGLWVWYDFCVGFVHNYPEEGWWSASTTGKGNVWSHVAVSWNGQIVKFFKVQFSESQSISKINGSVVVLPEKPMLFQNYPNPFNPETWIPYQLATDSPVMISIYNSKGQLIRVLNLGNQNAGIYMTKDKAAYWDGKDNVGEKVSSGIYFYTMRAGQFHATRRMVIIR